MTSGKVETLVVLGGNPVYNAPVDLAFAEAYSRVSTRLHLSLYEDETSRASTWHVPRAHFLESWDDARTADGTYSVVQPLISPLYGGKTPSELLALVLNEDTQDGFELVRRTFRELFGADDLENRWSKTVHDGLLEGSRLAEQTPALLATAAAAPHSGSAAAGEGQLEIVFVPSASVYDGRFANSGWLQETPDPLTKITWDNAALLHPATAKRLKVATDTLVKLKYAGREIELPAYLLPGQAPDTVVVAVGYGRTAAGHVGGDEAAGVAPVGTNAYRLRQSSAPSFDTGLVVEPTGRPHPLATTEDHHAIDRVGLAAKQRAAGGTRPRGFPGTLLTTTRISCSTRSIIRRSSRSGKNGHTKGTSGACRSTSRSASAAMPAWWLARPRTTCRWSARS